MAFPSPAHPTAAYATQRKDLWWVQPLVMVLLLGGFVVYATFRILEGNDPATRYFEVENGVATGATTMHYLSPFGTPDLTAFVPAGLKDSGNVGAFLAATFANPAAIVLPLPAGFRFTCYYYRKAYYRSFVGRPAGCSVEAVRGRKYRGERGLMVVQNLHRYFLYLAIIVAFFLLYDALRGIYTPHGWYFGIGNVLMLVNVGLIAGYTFGCHAFRHLVGGNLDCYSCDALSQTRYKWWQYVTRLNEKHALWAMVSLVSVALTDVYIRYLGVTGATHIGGIPA